GCGGSRRGIEGLEVLGQLGAVHGADAAQATGPATDVLQPREGAPAVMFDRVPGYDPGLRVLVNSFGSIDRIALTLGLPIGCSKVETSDAWRRRIKDLSPVPPVEVETGPVLENVRRGGDVDMTVFPAPRWHSRDGGRYIGTGSFALTREPDHGR